MITKKSRFLEVQYYILRSNSITKHFYTKIKMRRLLRYSYANSVVVCHKLYKKNITQPYGNENALP
jgi:hypothetical protein